MGAAVGCFHPFLLLLLQCYVIITDEAYTFHLSPTTCDIHVPSYFVTLLAKVRNKHSIHSLCEMLIGISISAKCGLHKSHGSTSYLTVLL